MNWGKLKASDWLKNFPERRLQSDWHFCRGKKRPFSPFNMEWKHPNRLPVCFLVFSPLFCLFFRLFCFCLWHLVCFNSLFFTQHTIIFNEFRSNLKLLCLPFPASSLIGRLAAISPAGIGGGMENFFLFFFFFFLVKQFWKISQVRLRGDSGI